MGGKGEITMENEGAIPNPPMTVSEFAAWARLSQNAVYDMIKKGEIPSIRFGRAIRIPRDTAAKILQAAEAAA
jgi:excisionase family DNA binding protein